MTFSASFLLPSILSAGFRSPLAPPARRLRARPPLRSELTRTIWPSREAAPSADRLTVPVRLRPHNRSTVRCRRKRSVQYPQHFRRPRCPRPPRHRHLIVLGQQQGHQITRLEAGQGLPGGRQHVQFQIVQHRNGLRAPGDWGWRCGNRPSAWCRRPGWSWWRWNRWPRRTGACRRRWRRHRFCRSCSRSCLPGRRSVGGLVGIDYHCRGGAGTAAHKHVLHHAGGVEVQRQGGAGIQPGVDLGPRLLLALIIGVDTAHDGVLDAGDVGDLRQLRGGQRNGLGSAMLSGTKVSASPWLLTTNVPWCHPVSRWKSVRRPEDTPRR